MAEIISQTTTDGGTVVVTYDDGSTLTTYPTGETVATDSQGASEYTSPDGTVSNSTPSVSPSEIRNILGSGNSGWIEKRSEANPKYPYNDGKQTESGHTFEMDDTPGFERIRLQHRIETFIEMHPDGSETHKIQGDQYEIIIKNKNVHIKGVCNITVEGDAHMTVQGDKYEYVRGNYTQVIDGEYSVTVKKDVTIQSEGDIKVAANPDFDGRLRLLGGMVIAKTDLMLDGELVANKITARTRVDAGLGISAGPLGIATIGGVCAGPGLVPVPGTVVAAINMSAPTSITNLSLSSCSFAVFAADAVNTLLHNMHIHPAPKGPTGTPIPVEMTA